MEVSFDENNLKISDAKMGVYRICCFPIICATSYVFCRRASRLFSLRVIFYNFL